MVFTRGKHSNPWIEIWNWGPPLILWTLTCLPTKPHKQNVENKTTGVSFRGTKQQVYTVLNNFIQRSAASFEGRGNFYGGIVFLLNFEGVVLRAVTICHGKINPETGPLRKRPFWKNMPPVYIYIFMIIYEYLWVYTPISVIWSMEPILQRDHSKVMLLNLAKWEGANPQKKPPKPSWRNMTNLWPPTNLQLSVGIGCKKQWETLKHPNKNIIGSSWRLPNHTKSSRLPNHIYLLDDFNGIPFRANQPNSPKKTCEKIAIQP